jgi:glucan phosphoethanolaminetransferase (alkaline phosphatase superfamily)
MISARYSVALRNPIVGAVLLTLLLLVLMTPLAFRIAPAKPTGDLLHAQAFGIALLFWLMWFAAFGAVSRAVGWALLLALTWWPAEMALRHTYALGVSASFIGLASGTNSAEFFELLWTFGGEIAMVGLPPLLLGVLTWRSMKALGWRISRDWRIRMFLGGLTLTACTWYVFADQDRVFRSAGPKDELAGAPSGFFLDSLSLVYPISGWIALDAARRNAMVVRAARERMDITPFAPVPTGEPGAELLVLVVGESSSALRWGLGGGPRPTTPRLSQRNDVVYFPDIVAPAVATRTAVSAMVSWRPLMRLDGGVDPRPEPGFLGAFNEAGWLTAWLTNQPAQGAFDNPLMFYAHDAKRQRFINPGTFIGATPYDEALIPELMTVIQEAGANHRVAAVVHTMGSHFNYAYRYPEAFDKYQPSLKGRPKDSNADLASNQEALNAYDNSILYTDHVLDRLIDNLAQLRRPASLIYLSDHGDDVPDGRCLSQVGMRTTASAARVPALVWVSPQLEALRPGLTARLRAASHQPMQFEWVAPTMMNLAGLRVPRHPAPDLLHVVNTRPRTIHLMGRAVEFDAAERSSPCSLSGAAKAVPVRGAN